MKYVSTRGRAEVLGFADVLLAGLASDGGLYLPETWPQLPNLDDLAGLSYPEVAIEVMWPFVEGEIDRADFERIVTESYSVFDDDRVCPVVPLGTTESGADVWLLELFRGPTLAFKDVALQLVGRLFDHVLTQRGERACILGATSGDTGSAAIESVRDRDHIDIFVLFPDGRVSDVQRRQMSTIDAENVHAVAVDGTFDDCQDLVKAAFADEEFRKEVGLSAVNSINWARVMAQIVYYVTAHLEVAPDHGPVTFSVPTGNFGNILAGWAAKQMGLPVDRLLVASNSNDILTRFFTTGTMEIREVVPTTSPSMDIQVSSNLERLLFEVLDRDGAAVADLMGRFRSDGTVSVSEGHLRRLGEEFDATRIDGESAAGVIRDVHQRRGMIIDPHTSVAVAAAEQTNGDPSVPVIALATADPAKFPDAVEMAIGIRPPLPPRLSDLFDRPERITKVEGNLAAVESLIRDRLRSGPAQGIASRS
ncbi:MAG: threonine synthase [Microthrixaceae bacterium]